MLSALGMIISLNPRQSAGTDRQGFTMIELALTITLIAIMTAMMVPKIGRIIQATRINREIAIVVQDLEQAFTIAARSRKPMRLSCTCGTQTYTIADRTGGTVRLSRKLGADADLGTLTLTFSASPVDIFPSGIATAPDTVRITSGTSTRAVVMTTGGQVRIIP
jgi:prepilin-type N-terminal cleavage/methylation domain-containing protein